MDSENEPTGNRIDPIVVSHSHMFMVVVVAVFAATVFLFSNLLPGLNADSFPGRSMSLRVEPALAQTTTSFKDGGNYAHIDSAGTTVVKNGSGYLHSVVLNELSTGAIILMDGEGESAKVIARIVERFSTGSYIYDLHFNSSLIVITEGDTDITVTYN